MTKSIKILFNVFFLLLLCLPAHAIWYDSIPDADDYASEYVPKQEANHSFLKSIITRVGRKSATAGSWDNNDPTDFYLFGPVYDCTTFPTDVSLESQFCCDYENDDMYFYDGSSFIYWGGKTYGPNSLGYITPTYVTGGCITQTGTNIIMGDCTTNYVANGNNVYIGHNTQDASSEGTYNTHVGTGAGADLSTANDYNTLIGAGALQGISSGTGNTIVGALAGFAVAVSDINNNTFIGYNAGLTAETSGSVIIGYNTGIGVMENNRLYIDNSNTSTPLIAGNFSQNTLTFNVQSITNTGTTYITDIETKAGGTALYVGADGELYFTSSSRKTKKNIKPLKFNAIDKLEAVTFQHKSTDEEDFGLIAEELEKVYPMAVVHKDGKPAGIHYEKLAVLTIPVIQSLQKQIRQLQTVLVVMFIILVIMFAKYLVKKT